LRLWALTRESIFLDEVSLHWLVADRPFTAMVNQVKAVENTPILGFALAWLAAKLGSAPEWVRLPALVAGTATIPAAAAVARRAVGHWTGLATALFVAASPFLNFFSVEARPYALACCFVTLATLTLLRACDADSQKWMWLLWAALAALAMLSHYTAIFAIGAQVLWALVFRPAARVRLLTAVPSAGVIFAAAWLGPFRDQLGHSDQQVQFMKFLAPVTAGQFAKVTATAIAGRPIVALSEVPGPFLGAVIAGFALAATAVILLAAARLGKGTRLMTIDGALRSDAGLVFTVATIPPICLVLASLASGGSFMLTRNAISAVPCGLILIAAGLSQFGSKLKLPAALTLTAALAATTVVGTLDWPRPLMREAADSIASRWHVGDLVVEQTFSQAALNDADLSPYLPAAVAASIKTARVPQRANSERVIRSAFEQASRAGASVFVIAPITQSTPAAAAPPGDLAARFKKTLKVDFGGAGPLQVVEWSQR